MKIYLDKIHVIENFISKEDCDYIINKYNQNIYDTPENNIKTGFSLFGEQLIKYCESGKEEVDKKVFKLMSNTLSEFYKEQIEIKSIFHSIMNIGAKNPPHWDNYAENKEEDISTLLYLNEGFIGGDLKFINQDITITPKSGMFVFFKGEESLIHEVEEVLEGSRQALIGMSWPTKKRMSLDNS
jgi:Rps23 Pro-64 3,4-dihydroxylase Tpa1-like proline 4-hydroxylase